MKAGLSYGHYFLQDLWAATKVFDNKVIYHVDVASRIDGFVAHLLPFCKVDYVDIRDIDSNLKNLTYVKGDICNLPYGDNSIDSLSCLHVLEHIGLGRYGDDIDPEGYIKGAKELSRILKPGGNLYFSTPVGNEKLCFDAHRVFSPITIIETFNCLELISFSLIDDKGESIIENADYELAHSQNYGCGLFVFKKTILNL
jgi:SAM-dependent methyltransferase